MRAFLRKLTGLAPPSIRRAAAGALVDLKGLPGRIRDPELRSEPWAFIHNVGGGHYLAVGEHLMGTLQRHADLKPTDTVLDIGCGTGRVATPLARFLASGGAYVGFDVAKAAIRECRRRFAGQPHMRFAHLDVFNGDYNAGGKVAELDTVFPVADASVDLAFATSVFTHMRMAPVRRYLAETARTLKPGGRFAFTAFVLQPGRTEGENFPFRDFDETSAIIDPRSPERAIAHRREVLEAACVAAGLKVTSFHQGAWAPIADYEGFQDLFVVTRPKRSAGSRRRG